MKLTAQIQIDGDNVDVILADGRVSIGPATRAVPAGVARLYAQKKHVVAAGSELASADQLITIAPAWEVAPAALETLVSAQLVDDVTTAPDAATAAFWGEAEAILQVLGFSIAPIADAKPKKVGKARHRFDKTLVDVPFTVAFNDAHAEVYWVKSKEMVIKRGATLKADPIFNQDGSLKYDSKYALQLRADHAASVAANRTTADITLRSVNEVGMFLYFGNANGWLQLKDAAGRTLDELTVVK